MTLTEKILARAGVRSRVAIATVDFDNDTIEINGKVHQLKSMGDVRPMIEAGGSFNYARESGMIPKS